MEPTLSRRDALASASIIALSATAATALARAGRDDPVGAGGPWPSFPHQNPVLVKEMVGVCHRDLARATELVTAEPSLVNATWEWGLGDWETALGAASHTGRREIAEMLLAAGARLDIFAAASLGYTDVVKAMIAARPGIQRTWGPHGIPLAAHARAGGDESKDTLEYLLSLGDADSPPPVQQITDAQRAVYEGTYSFGPGAADRLVVKVNKQWLELLHGDEVNRRIHCMGNHTFFSAGVPSAPIVFEVDGSVAKSFTVNIGGVSVHAVKV